MKKYFLIRQESDPKVIGVKTGLSQIELMQQDKSYQLLDEFLDIFTYWDKKNFALPDSISMSTLGAQPLKGAKLTDFLRFRPYLICCPFVIHENVKQIFKEFVLSEHYFIPVEILNRDHAIELCYLLYMPALSYEVIDFSKSIFYRGGVATEKKQIQIASHKEYSMLLDENPIIGRDKIVLTDKFDNKLDFFSTRLADMFISERLKQRILSESLTGIKVFDEQDLICESK